MTAYALKARYLFPIDGPPIPDGVLTLAGDRIVAVGGNISGNPPRDLGNVAVLPGLINAHAHLEFSDLPSPLGQPGMAFTDWLAAVVTWRRQQLAETDSVERRYQAAERGLQEVARTGTAAVGEIASPGWPEAAFQASPLDTTVFLELLGLAPQRVEPLLASAAAHLANPASPSKWRAGLAPHASYTISLELLARTCPLSRQYQAPVALHLAETREELELLQSGTGPFVPLLQAFDAWHPDVIPRGTRPLDFLRVLAQAHRALVIHGNYLNSEEITFLAARAARMSLVYCPRTHAYFGHEPYPLASLLAAGVNVAVGTDSRASNPDLDLWGELRYLQRDFGDAVAGANVLRMGTLAGAAALGIDQDRGSLAPGKAAWLTIVPLPDGDAADPYELLFDSPGASVYHPGATADLCGTGGAEYDEAPRMAERTHG
jgi:cytosine/adenosine deaminase-related metal-dependent hydrolase